ncbi:MAG: hypothetical protein ACF8R7_05260 [Phycisphaerales bacterium JB039]
MNAVAVSDQLVVSHRGRVRIRLGPVMVEWRAMRVVPRAVGPPGGAWGPAPSDGLPGYGRREPDGSLAYWRPLPPRA